MSTWILIITALTLAIEVARMAYVARKIERVLKARKDLAEAAEHWSVGYEEGYHEGCQDTALYLLKGQIPASKALPPKGAN